MSQHSREQTTGVETVGARGVHFVYTACFAEKKKESEGETGAGNYKKYYRDCDQDHCRIITRYVCGMLGEKKK